MTEHDALVSVDDLVGLVRWLSPVVKPPPYLPLLHLFPFFLSFCGGRGRVGGGGGGGGGDSDRMGMGMGMVRVMLIGFADVFLAMHDVMFR